MKTENKIALVTGGSRGLGKNMAIALAKKGIDIVLTYNSNKVEADKVVAEIETIGQKAIALQLDAGNVKSFDEFLTNASAELEKLTGSKNFDFLINNAGTGLYAPFAETTEEQFDNALNIHYKGVFFLTRVSLKTPSTSDCCNSVVAYFPNLRAFFGVLPKSSYNAVSGEKM